MSLGDDSGPRPTLEEWESALIRAVAARIRTTERDDLESVLALHLLELKHRFVHVARNWRAFATTALRNKASNWIRDRQLLEGRWVSVDSPVDRESPHLTVDSLRSPESSADLAIAIRLVRAGLDDRLREVWDALVETNGNQVQVAKRFKAHRNTVRLWVNKIRDTLRRHGLDLPQQHDHMK